MSSDLLNGLNEQQHAAVTAPPGPMLVLAGPGSGKTGVLTRRIAYLIREMHIPPHRILAVTFTNKAASEMRHRVESYLGERLRGLQLGTFHATCARLLRIESDYINYTKDFVIYDTDDQLKAVQQAMVELDIDSKSYSSRSILNRISNAKNEMILPDSYVGQDYPGALVGRVYKRYQAILRESNAMDFDDLLMQMVLAMRNIPALRDKYQQRFEYVLVDEFQDTNTVQYQLVGLFAKPQNNVFVVGDEDQSIYAFRGADYRNVLRFRHDFPDSQVILLEQNYRSTQVVLDVARAVIDNNTNRTPKALFTTRAGGETVTIHESPDEKYEALFVTRQISHLIGNGYNYSDIAVMYRANSQSRMLELTFVNNNVPYDLIGGVGFYKTREIKDILAYLRIIHNPDDRIAFVRVINTPKRGIGKKSLQDFQNWAADKGLTYGEALDKLMHGVKTPLSSRATKSFMSFGEQMRSWRDIALSGDLVNLFDTILSDSRYGLHLVDISETRDQEVDRRDNVAQLRGLLVNAQEDGIALGDFLADQTLMSDADTVDTHTEKVTMMTLHAAKGLEFPVVFITGIEEGLLPHFRAFEEADGIEEERRLFYVGITRAKDRLYLTHASTRTTYSGRDHRTFSDFLTTIPPELLKGQSSALYSANQSPSYNPTQWDSGKQNKPRQRDSGLNRLDKDLDQFNQSKLPPFMDFPDSISKSKPTPEKPPATSDSGIRDKVVPFPGTKPLRYRAGQHVKHPFFGKGIVVQSKRAGRDDEEVTVSFTDTDFGIKKVLASAANMRILD